MAPSSALVKRTGRPLISGISSRNAGAASGKKTTPKPEFDVSQQHYSPKKAERHLGVRSAASGDNRAGQHETLGQRAEAVHLQDELLQLSLVHEKSGESLRLFEASIKSRLRREFADVERQRHQVKTLERVRQEKVNAVALKDWLENENGYSGQQKLQILGSSMEELDDLAKTGGAFEKLMDDFDQWHTNVASIIQARTGEGTVHFVERMAPSWSDSASSLYHQLMVCVKSLDILRSDQEAGAIAAVLNLHSLLAHRMMEEIQTCREVETGILRHEQDWIATSMTKALEDVQPQSEQPSRRIGVWENGEPGQGVRGTSSGSWESAGG